MEASLCRAQARGIPAGGTGRPGGGGHAGCKASSRGSSQALHRQGRSAAGMCWKYTPGPLPPPQRASWAPCRPVFPFPPRPSRWTGAKLPSRKPAGSFSAPGLGAYPRHPSPSPGPRPPYTPPIPYPLRQPEEVKCYQATGRVHELDLAYPGMVHSTRCRMSNNIDFLQQLLTLV